MIALIVILAVCNLIGVKVVSAIVFVGGLDPTDYLVFQSLFGMIMTVIIALEFKRSLLVVGERRHGVVQVRTVVLIALLAIVRKLLILDFSNTEAAVLFGLAAAIFSRSAASIGSFVIRIDAIAPATPKLIRSRNRR